MSPLDVVFLSSAREITGGAEEGMLGVLRHYPAEDPRPLVIAPGGGALERRVRALDIRFRAWDAPTLPMGLRGTKLPRFALGVTRGRRSLVRMLRETPPSLITTHSMEAHVLGSAAAARVDCPVLWHVRDIHTEPGERWALRWGIRFRSPACVFLTEACRDALPPRRTPSMDAVLADGVDLERFERAADDPVHMGALGRPLPVDEVRPALGIPADACVIAYVGQILPRKRVDLLVDALERVPETAAAPVHGLIAGTGPEQDGPGHLPALRARAASGSHAARLHLVGHATPIASLLRTIDVVVLPSRGEALGLVLLEAMAAGIPVIAAHDGGMPEVVRDGETGLLVPPDNVTALTGALAELAGDPTLRQRLGEAGRKRVHAHFDARRQAEAIAGVHRRVAASAPGGVV